MFHPIREQFVQDMQVAGLAESTQTRYLVSVCAFFKAVWLAPADVAEHHVQAFLIALRERNVARETFRNYRYALQFFFQNTLGRDWPLFKKN